MPDVIFGEINPIEIWIVHSMDTDWYSWYYTNSPYPLGINSQQGNHWGLKKNEATCRVVPGPRLWLSWELKWILNGYGFMLLSHNPWHGNDVTGRSKFAQFPTPSFSTDFDTVHGIKSKNSLQSQMKVQYSISFGGVGKEISHGLQPCQIGMHTNFT